MSVDPNELPDEFFEGGGAGPPGAGGGSASARMLNELLSGGGFRGGGTDGPPDRFPSAFLGVPEGFSARRRVPRQGDVEGPQLPTPRVTVTPWEIPGFFNLSPREQINAMRNKMEEKRRQHAETGILAAPPRYHDASPTTTFFNLSPAERAQLQRDLAGVGLLDEYREGVLDPNTERALATIMAHANQTGTTWQQGLLDFGRRQVIEAEENAPPEPQFAEPTYLAPDYATLAQRVKSQFRQLLDRDPTEAELAGLADELSSFHRQSFEAEVEAARQDFANRQIAGEGETPPTPDDVTATDPVARFQELFEERFASAIATEQEEEFSGEAFGNLMQSLNVGRQVMGG